MTNHHFLYFSDTSQTKIEKRSTIPELKIKDRTSSIGTKDYSNKYKRNIFSCFIYILLLTTGAFSYDFSYLGLLGIEKPNYFQIEYIEGISILSSNYHAMGIGYDLIAGISSSEIGPIFSFYGKSRPYIYGLKPLIGYKYNTLWALPDDKTYYGLMAKIILATPHNGMSFQIGIKGITQPILSIGFSWGGGTIAEWHTK